MVTKLKVLEFFLGLEFFRTCARLKALQRRNSRFWQACVTRPRPMAIPKGPGGRWQSVASAARAEAALGAGARWIYWTIQNWFQVLFFF